MKFSSDLRFPRSSGDEWNSLQQLHGTPLDELTEVDFDVRHANFHPASSSRVDNDTLRAWRDDLNRWAYDKGFPASLNQRELANWNVDLGARLLEDTSELPEAENPEIWCWLATNLLPHFVVYRWGWPANATPNRTVWHRFGAGGANGLYMARQRVKFYGEELSRRASEQEFQSLQYRVAFGIDQRVARIILHTLLEAADDFTSNYGKMLDEPSPGVDGTTRSQDADDVCTELRVINSLRPFCFASDETIVEIVQEVIGRLPEIRKRLKVQREYKRAARKPSTV